MKQSRSSWWVGGKLRGTEGKGEEGNDRDEKEGDGKKKNQKIELKGTHSFPSPTRESLVQANAGSLII